MLLTTLDMPQFLICLTLSIVLSLLSIFGLNNLILLYLKSKLCWRREIAYISANVSEWPNVSVHVATYNEGDVVSRLLDSCLRLDYPADKVEVIVVDDSTDETISILRDYERRYYPRIKVIHRSERTGYKAGALNEALKYSRGEYILVLDADSVPKPDFLKKTIPLFLADEKLGFVQGKPRYLNAENSWLTRALALINDWFAVFLQSTLSGCGMIVSFLGHGGVFRRRALEDIGGWMSDTITEDIDAAYRVQLRGWRAIFYEEAESFEEVPPRYYSAVRRFKRHIKGPIQNLVKHAAPIIRHREISALKKFEALIQLAYPLVYPLGLLLIAMNTLTYLLVPGAILDHFWHTGLGYVCSLLMLLIFPYASIIVSPIPSMLTIAIAALFALILLPRDVAVRLRRADLKAMLGVALIWNDNLINCLIPILEVIAGGTGEWIPTERALSHRGSVMKDKRAKLKEGMIRVTASILLLASYAAILHLNFSLNSIGIIIPAALWLCSAYMIMKG
ncbi:glycosyltransferase [Candidatus Bathyarchaeota archaeon]|nr:glycosyltransferase [Candidatus Bathyarchaeota archaeon]